MNRCLLGYIAYGVHLCINVLIVKKWTWNSKWDVWTRVYFRPRDTGTQGPRPGDLDPGTQAWEPGDQAREPKLIRGAVSTLIPKQARGKLHD